MRTTFRLPIPVALAFAFAYLLSPLAAQEEPGRDHVPPPKEVVDTPRHEEPPANPVNDEAHHVANAADAAHNAEHEATDKDKNAKEAESVEAVPVVAVPEVVVATGGAAAEDTTDHGDLTAHDGDGDPHGEAEHHGGAHRAHRAEPVTLWGNEYYDTGQFFLKLINFLIFAGLLFLMLKGALSKMFKARTLDIEVKLAQSNRDKWEAEDQLRNLDAKMAGLEGELAGILERAESDAETEKQRILDAARAEADQLMVQARAEIDHQRRVAEAELRELVAKLALEGAEKRVSQMMVGDSASKVMDQAIRRVGGAS